MNADLESLLEPKQAPLVRRIAAFFIDQALLFAVVIGLTIAFGVDTGDASDTDRNSVLAISLMGIALAITYHTVAVARYGRTLGKRLMSLRVVSMPQGGQVSWSYAALRALVPAAAVLLPVVGNVAGIAVYAWAIFDKRRRGLHDKLAGTMVTPE